MPIDPRILRQAFKEGVEARAAGTLLADNPYAMGTDERVEWSEGWQAVFDLDEDPDPESTRVVVAETVSGHDGPV